MSVAAIVVAGGEGTRMQSQVNKIFLKIGGQSILERSLALLQSSPLVDEIVLVGRSRDMPRFQPLAADFPKLRSIVAGGDLRHRSEFAGLRAIASRIDAGEIEAVLVHDAVRPFATQDLVRRVVEGAHETIGCVPGVPVDRHTLVVDNGSVRAYPRNLWAIQTPQAFQATWLLEAHNKASRQGFIGTDTASVIEWAGGDVRVVEGEPSNIKITTPDDLAHAERIVTRLARADPAGLV